MVKSLQDEIRDFFNEKLSFDEMNKYESALESYYLKKYHLDRLIHVMEKIVPYIKPNSKVLDIGSDGVFPYISKKIVKNIETYAVSKGYDKIFFSEDGRAYSEMSTGFENKNVKEENVVILQKCDLNKERLPFDDNSIDVLTCFEVLEHIYSDPMHMMLEAKRVLKKQDGIFFLSTPNINSLKALKRTFNMESPYFWPPYSKTDSEIGHVKEYSINEIKLLFEKSGFSILEIETFNHKEDKIFSHDKLYQSGNMLSVQENFEQVRFNNDLDDFLDSINWNKQFRGDYTFVMSRPNNNKVERYFFPLYESY